MKHVVAYLTKDNRVITTRAEYPTAQAAQQAADRHNRAQKTDTYRAYLLAETETTATETVERGAEEIWYQARSRWFFEFLTPTTTPPEADWSALPEDTKRFWRETFSRAVRAAYDTAPKKEEEDR